jgi:hypothetical protein
VAKWGKTTYLAYPVTAMRAPFERLQLVEVGSIVIDTATYRLSHLNQNGFELIDHPSFFGLAPYQGARNMAVFVNDKPGHGHNRIAINRLYSVANFKYGF